MALIYAPDAAVAGDPGALRGTARTLATLITDVSGLAGDARADLGRTAGYWSGTAGDAYRGRMTAELRPYGTLVNEVLPAIGRACDTLAADLETAQAQLRTALAAAAGIGLPNRLILGLLGYGKVASHQRTTQHSRYPDYWVRYGNWQAITAFQAQHKVTAAYFQPIVDQASLAFKTAREARLAFVHAVGPTRQELARMLYDEPTRREQELDRAVGAGEEGNFATGVQYVASFLPWESDPDPEGRILLYRWREPYDAPAVYYRDGSSWSDYLKGNQALRQQLDQVVRDLAVEAVRSGGDPFDQRGNMAIENGYGTGAEQLHGTEASVGDFHIEGAPTVRPLPGGGHEVILDTTYTWNDIIDPNLGYRMDWWASSLQPGTPYDIHIEWSERTTVILDSAGVPIAVHGYPTAVPTR